MGSFTSSLQSWDAADHLGGISPCVRPFLRWLPLAHSPGRHCRFWRKTTTTTFTGVGTTAVTTIATTTAPPTGATATTTIGRIANIIGGGGIITSTTTTTTLGRTTGATTDYPCSRMDARM